MAMLAAADLLDRIITYCRQSRMAETTFGRRAVNDGKLVARLRNGRSVSLDTAARVEAFIAGHVHMPAHGMLGATPVLTCPSTWRLRARLRLGAPGYEIEDAPAGFALHVRAGGGLTSHVVTL